ncbi:MAG: hypothetical protein VX642_13530 [Bdellovibrionota bacterium]|nr:hypothetical protein [Bdellovibrionota bacterium]
MFKSLIFLFLTNIAVVQSYAMEACKYSPLPKESGSITGEKLISAGELIHKNNSINSLADGEYLYVIDSDFRLVISPRFFKNKTKKLNDAPKFAAHLSLESFLINETQTDTIQIFAAGEFRIFNNQVLFVNNRSGSFRGNQDSLNLAKVILAENGLNIGSTSSILNYEKAKDLTNKDLFTMFNGGHSTLSLRSIAFNEVSKSESLVEIILKLKPIYKLLSEKYPNDLNKQLVDPNFISRYGIKISQDDLKQKLVKKIEITNFLANLNCCSYEYAIFMHKKKFEENSRTENMDRDYPSQLLRFIEELKSFL